MRRSLAVLWAAAAMVTAGLARADEIGRYSIQEALDQPAAKQKLDPNIRLYFRHNGTPGYAQSFGSVHYARRTNRMSTARNGPCHWAFLSGLLALQGKARERGANAIVDIVPLTDGKLTAPPGQYDCEFGMLMVSIGIKGEMVRMADR